MRYVKLGNTGYEVSRLGFGAMRLPTVEFGEQEFVDLDLATEVIQAAFKTGVNYIDTAFASASALDSTILASPTNSLSPMRLKVLRVSFEGQAMMTFLP